jgi:hypothetical protein
MDSDWLLIVYCSIQEPNSPIATWITTVSIQDILVVCYTGTAALGP